MWSGGVRRAGDACGPAGPRCRWTPGWQRSRRTPPIDPRAAQGGAQQARRASWTAAGSAARRRHLHRGAAVPRRAGHVDLQHRLSRLLFPALVAGAPLTNDIVKCRLGGSTWPTTRSPSRRRRSPAAADLPGRRLRLVPARRRAAAPQGHVAHVSARWSLPQPEPRRGRRRGPRPTRPPRRPLKRDRP